MSAGELLHPSRTREVAQNLEVEAPKDPAQPMIDWLTACCTILDPDGKRIEPECVPALRWHRLIRVEEETGTAVRESHVPLSFSGVRATIVGSQVRISGNPTRFTQGENSYSLKAPWATVDKMLQWLLRCWELPGHQLAIDQISRIDLTQQIHCDTRDRCMLTLEAMKRGWTVPRSKRSTVEQTVYLGQTSQERTLKAYCKGASRGGGDMPDLGEFLRVEVCLRSKGMKSRFLDPASPRSWDLTEIFAKELQKTRLALPASTVESRPVGLSASMRGHLDMWRTGMPLKSMLKPSTYSYVRRELLKHGIDIAVNPTSFKPGLVNGLTKEELLDRSRWHATSYTRADVARGVAARCARQ